MKRLIVVGNKEYDDYHLADQVDAFDYVCRINRMTNYYHTGTKIDGIYLGAWWDWIYVYKGGPYLDIIQEKAKQVFMMEFAYNLNLKEDDKWEYFITPEQHKNLTLVDFSPGAIRIGWDHPCSSISMIDYFIRTPEWSDNYEIWFTGLDVENRGDILASGPQWADGEHKEGGDLERMYLERMMQEGRLHHLK